MNSEKPSRYKRHRSYLKLSKELKPEDIPTGEQAEIERITLKPLLLKKKKSFLTSPWMALTLAAAATLFFVISSEMFEPTTKYTIKGDLQVIVYAQRDGEVVRLEEGKARTGDLIQFAVVASQPGKAYLSIVDRNAISLMTAELVLATVIELQAGQSKQFADAIELTESDDGEQGEIYVCALNFTPIIGPDGKIGFDSCARREFRLRL